MAGEPNEGPPIGVNSSSMPIASWRSTLGLLRFCPFGSVPVARSHRGLIGFSLTRDVQALWIVVHPDRLPR
jgi:hypothetical protein